jgi:membrane carboxypeptidase/penicillin-binding protein
LFDFIKCNYPAKSILFIPRRLKVLYAVEMENTLGKRRILSLYLNTVDWGPGICGAAQAANVYFGRKPVELSAVQAAWLAGILRNPQRAWQHEYLPQQPDRERLAWVLGFMPKKVRQMPLELRFLAQAGQGSPLVVPEERHSAISTKF